MLRRFLAAFVTVGLALAISTASADVPISGLPAAGSVGSTDLTVIVQSGTTKKATAAQLVAGGVGVLPVANGGTGSGTQNFVDLTNPQTVAGVKTFSSPPVMSGASITAATVPMNAMPLSFFRNKLINGGGGIDQRNNGSSVTPTDGQYTIDRWVASLTQSGKFSVQQLAATQGMPGGLRVTSLSNYSVISTDNFRISQPIEANNTVDLQFGTASASSIAVSFLARSSLTGNFGCSIRNTLSGATRSYPCTFSIPVANTWTQESIIIPGDVTGTWTTSGTAVGLVLGISLGAGSTFSGTASTWAASNLTQPTSSVSVVGTNAATFDLTGVQLESGSVSTPFERRPVGMELSLAQRYCFAVNALSDANTVFSNMSVNTSTTAIGVMHFPVQMRALPSLTATAAAGFMVNIANVTTTMSSSPTVVHNSTVAAQIVANVASGLTAGQAGWLQGQLTSAQLTFSAEL